MRIAVLCTDQGVRVPSGKGASLHLLAISRAFAQLGHEVLLLGVAGRGAPPLEPTTHLFPHPGRAEGLVRERNKLALMERITREGAPVLREFEPDLVYERLALFGTAGVRLAQEVGAVHVLEVNALLAREDATWRGLRLAATALSREATALRSADHVVAVSDEVAEQVRTIRAAPGITTVPNGFDEEAFAGPTDKVATRRRHGLGPRTPVALFVGSLRPWHGVEYAIRALPQLPDVTLVIVGDGPQRLPLGHLAEDLGVATRVLFTGQLPHLEVVALLRAADVGIAPYPDLDDFSFSPLKVYEYLAAGLPYVASAVGQLRAVASEFGAGQLVPPGHPASLASAILRSLTDPSAADRAADARALALRRCGWRTRAAQILAAVHDAPALRPRSGVLG